MRSNNIPTNTHRNKEPTQPDTLNLAVLVGGQLFAEPTHNLTQPRGLSACVALNHSRPYLGGNFPCCAVDTCAHLPWKAPLSSIFFLLFFCVLAISVASFCWGKERKITASRRRRHVWCDQSHPTEKLVLTLWVVWLTHSTRRWCNFAMLWEAELSFWIMQWHRRSTWRSSK